MVVEVIDHRYSYEVQELVKRQLDEHSMSRIEIGHSLGNEAVLDVYDTTCNALSMSDDELMARATMLDSQPPEPDSPVSMERDFFGSLVANYNGIRAAYEIDPRLDDQQADARAYGALRQAVAERTYRLSRLGSTSVSDYKALLNNPVFQASVRLVATMTYHGWQELMGHPDALTGLPVPA